MFSKFSNLQNLSIYTLTEHHSDFLDLVKQENIFLHADDGTGFSSVGQTQANDQYTLEMIANQHCDVSSINAIQQDYQVLTCPLYERCLSEVQFEILSEMYAALYPYVTIHWISRFYREARRLIINGEELLSLTSQSDRSAMVTAKWQGRHGIDILGQEPKSVGIIRSLIQHTIHVAPQGTSEETPTILEHVLAQVDWHENHPQRDFFSEIIIIVASTIIIGHQLTGVSFIPVSRIIARCAYVKTSYKFQIVICVPLL